MKRRRDLCDISILIVEDNIDTAQELQAMLEFDFTIIYTASDGFDGFEKYKQYRPDCIVTDVNMPCMSGIEMTNKIRLHDTKTPIIYLSAHSDIKYLQKAIDQKASAYILKPISYDELLEKITTHLTIDNSDDPLYSLLSRREYSIFLDIIKGIKPAEIALKYSVKPKTISTYRSRILSKLNMTSNSELITYAAKRNII